MASRTDKGVHASYAVASVECGDYFTNLEYLQKQLNKFSHPFIHIKKIEKVKDDFEVRFDVKSREYRYIFLTLLIVLLWLLMYIFILNLT